MKPTQPLPLSLYIHFPWCLKKCPYCDFNSHEFTGELPEQNYINALLTDLEQDINFFKESRPIKSIFMGGGTPSLFSPDAIHSLLANIKKLIPVNATAEITLEANPSTFENQKFSEFKSAGINRLSIGIQSFNDSLLKNLGRTHNSQMAMNAGAIAHSAGFNNFNLDLMFGLPEGSLKTSLYDIKTAISLQPSHISFYQLTLEPNTYFHKFPPTLPPDDDIFHTQTICQQHLSEHHFQQYEISAYAQLNKQCQHNLNYWTFGDYLGIGAGAHGKIRQQTPDTLYRYWKLKNPQHYLNAAGSDKRMGNCTTVATPELPLEYLMNQLRLTQGFHLSDYQNKTGLPSSSLYPALQQCIDLELLTLNQNHVRCTPQGWNFIDRILEQFFVD